MRTRLHLAPLLALLTAASAQQTQTPPPPTPPAAKPATPPQDATATLSLSANLVNLPVIVRDKKGALVQTLTKADFALAVDGHNQTIRYFDHDANLPLTLGLLVDTSQSQRSVLDEERDASTSFLEGMIASSADHAFIAQFAREVELLQDLTNSKPKLQAGLKQIGTENPSSSNPTDDTTDSHSNHRGGGTTLYDAVFLSGDELMQKQKGRKALIILSDGVDRNSKESLNHSIEAAQRADTIIYAIYFKGQEHQDHQDQNQRNNGGGFPGGGGHGYPGGMGYPGGGGGNRGGGNRGGQQQDRVDGKKILQKMADETGGRLFEVKGKEKVADIYTQIAEELRTQYRLGYTPDATITGDGYHQVDLGIPAQKNLHVQTRDGYYTGK